MQYLLSKNSLDPGVIELTRLLWCGASSKVLSGAASRSKILCPSSILSAPTVKAKPYPVNGGPRQRHSQIQELSTRTRN